jgi:hypothetical protein
MQYPLILRRSLAGLDGADLNRPGILACFDCLVSHDEPSSPEPSQGCIIVDDRDLC